MLTRSVLIRRPLGISCAPRRRWPYITVLGVLLTVVAGGLWRGPRCRLGSGKVDTAYYLAGEYIRDGYPAWSLDNAGHNCPHQLTDLNPYTFRQGNDTRDPWGTPMRMTCADAAIEVRSAGPDRAFYTEDDIQLMSAASAATRSTE